jgi:hypothetical protein
MADLETIKDSNIEYKSIFVYVCTNKLNGSSCSAEALGVTEF